MVSSDGDLLALGSSSVLPRAFVKGRDDAAYVERVPERTAIGICSVCTPRIGLEPPLCIGLSLCVPHIHSGSYLFCGRSQGWLLQLW